MSEEKTKGGQFAAGRSGNPKGRKPGQSEAGRLRAIIAARAPEVIAVLLRQALSGDVQAARLVLERALAPLKAIEPPQVINMPTGTLAEAGAGILAAVAAGELAPSQGASLLSAVGTLSGVIKVGELADRLAAVEAKLNGTEGTT